MISKVFTATDQQYMREAISLAERGLYSASPNPRVGCVLVKSDQVIGRGWHRQAGLPHAEIEALHDCVGDPAGATAYVTLEPCSFHGKTPPCADALLNAGISRVVAGSTDPNPRVSGSGLERLQTAGVDVVAGCEEDACVRLNPGFFSRMQKGRPFVRVKMAMSLDGRTALANGESQWITGDAARADVQHWRAQADCVLTGIGTVLLDDPQLNVRLTQEQFQEHGHGTARQPLLAIVDSSAQTPPTARLFEAERGVLIYSNVATVTALNPACEVITQNSDRSVEGINLHAMLEDLARREINEVHVEAGARLCASLIKDGLADELLLYIAPHLLGADARSLFALGGFTRMDERIEFELAGTRQVGKDLRLQLRPTIGL